MKRESEKVIDGWRVALWWRLHWRSAAFHAVVAVRSYAR